MRDIDFNVLVIHFHRPTYDFYNRRDDDDVRLDYLDRNCGVLRFTGRNHLCSTAQTAHVEGISRCYFVLSLTR